MSPPAPAVIEKPTPEQILDVQSKMKGGATRIDEISINEMLVIYPAEIHDAVRWVAKFLREKCGGNMSMLVHKCAQIKFKKDSSYFYKIFTGSYFIPDNRHGNRDGELVGSVKNFLALVAALQGNYQLDITGRLPFVMTDTAEGMVNYIDHKCAPGRVCKFGVILGATGRQKSATMRHYATAHTCCIHVECPATPSLGQCVSDVAAWFGTPRDSNMNRKIQAITKGCGQKHIILCDNVQRLYRKAGRSVQPIFGFFQKLQDDTNCTVIFIDVPSFRGDLLENRDAGYFEQFVGRAGGVDSFLEIEPYATDADIKAISRSFSLEPDKETFKLLKRASRQQGRDRILFNSLQDAAFLAEADGKELNGEYIQQICGEMPDVKEAA